jgi:thioredoxin-like negative regulator of GroEL
MQRKWMWIALIGTAGIGIGANAMLRGDSMQSGGVSAADEQVWFVQQQAAIAKDPDAMGIMALDEAAVALQNSGVDKQIEFFQKMLADSRNHAVQRHIRLKLADLYMQNGRGDNALEQLQQLITEPS